MGNNSRRTYQNTINTFLKMDLEKEFNSLIPEQFGGMDKGLLDNCIKICKLSNLIAIQDYLYKHGANDEKINDEIKTLKNR